MSLTAGAIEGIARRRPAAAAKGGVNLALRVDIVAERSAFDALAGDWRALEAEATAPVLFQSYDWCRAIWDHWSGAGRAFAPRVLVARDGGRTVGILPLKLDRFGPLRIATGFGEPFQQYSEALLSAGAPAGTAAALVAAARRLKGADTVEILKVRSDGALGAALIEAGAGPANADAAPFVDLAAFPSFAGYHATVNAKTRKNMRNSRNRLARLGRLQHTLLTDPAEVAALIARAHAGRERWLAELGLTSRAFRDDSFLPLACRLGAGGAGLRTMAMSLTLDGQPIADQWGFVHNGRYYAYVATWDPAFEESSPGKLQLEDVIRECFAQGLAVADFLMPAARYKFTWTDHAVAVADYNLPCSWRGGLHAKLWTGSLRPVLKRWVLALPDGVRSHVMGTILGRQPATAAKADVER